VSLGPQSSFEVQLNGAIPGQGHDQLKVIGTVNLGDPP